MSLRRNPTKRRKLSNSEMAQVGCVVSGAGADGTRASAEAPTVGSEAPIAIAVPDLDPRTRQPFTTNGLRRYAPGFDIIFDGSLAASSLPPSCRAGPPQPSDMHVALLKVLADR